eukprot:GILI01014402.1.p1 GENE.GILI01014402.1~~GILI01014402.1.p1  ORF type:complete len:298 (-),score=60.94 GILI01014402.1:90-983(-)
MDDDGLRIRDRSEEFAALRRAVQRQQQWMRGNQQETSAAPPTHSSALSGTANPNGEKTVAPPWVRVVSHCGELENTIQKKITQLMEIQREYLAPKFSVAANSDGLQDEERALRIEVMGNEIQKLLKELDRMVKTGVRPVDPENTDECMTATNVQRHLSTRFTKIVSAYKDGQTLYADKLKKRKQKVKQFKGSTETHQELEKELRVTTYQQMGYSQAHIQELLMEEDHQQTISNEMEEILNHIQELNSMFSDLRDLVVEQGTMLDRIDHNVTQARDQIVKGNTQLKEARHHQSKCLVC